MYLSHLLIDVGDNPDRPRPGRLWLRDLYRVHQRLCMAFPLASSKENDLEFLQPFKPDSFERLGPKQVHKKRAVDVGFIFRIDPQTGGSVAIIVQSAIQPDWEYAFHNAAHFLAAPPQCKPFNLNFEAGQLLRFRLLANPTKKTGTMKKEDRQNLSKDEFKKKEGRHGRRIFVEDKDLPDWLAKRAERLGFSFNNETLGYRPGYIYATLSDSRQRLRSVLYEGVLKVTVPEQFQKTLIAGIGPAKSLGFGLLSVATFPPAQLPEEK